MGVNRPIPRPKGSVSARAPSTPPPSTSTFFLGRFRVVDEIGVGGMATVHLARMDGAGGFQKWVAIKRIHPHLVEDEQFVRMFLDEARIAASISHPNVAQVFELGAHEDTYWIAMEYLHGEPLREVMRRNDEFARPMSPDLAARIISDAAEGLHAAHELRGKNGESLNLVHRDVSPHNLFLTYDGMVKVVDFGIAKMAGQLSSTQVGTLKGKVAYMSPEQVRGEEVDRRTDIFALGVVLWELTTGKRLFRMESDIETLDKVVECEVPRPSQVSLQHPAELGTSVVSSYPLELEKIVLRALAKSRAERFQTAREFSRALQQYLVRAGRVVGPEDIGAYVSTEFSERIRSREDRLRWAAEVTNTINVEAWKPKGIDSMDLSSLSVESLHDTVRPQIGEKARPPLAQSVTIGERPQPVRIDENTAPVSAQAAAASQARASSPWLGASTQPSPMVILPSDCTDGSITVDNSLDADSEDDGARTMIAPAKGSLGDLKLREQIEPDDDDDDDDACTVYDPRPRFLGKAPEAAGFAVGRPTDPSPPLSPSASTPPDSDGADFVIDIPLADEIEVSVDIDLGAPSARAALPSINAPPLKSPSSFAAVTMQTHPVELTTTDPKTRSWVVYVAAALGAFFIVIGIAGVLWLRHRAALEEQAKPAPSAEP